MCVETLWRRCHRRIITDHLLAAGATVFEVLGPGQVKPADMNPGVRVVAGGRLAHPAKS
jgi:hypothetical protein